MHGNAFEGIWFGANSMELLGALPADLMHLFYMELFHMLPKQLCPLTPTEKLHWTFWLFLYEKKNNYPHVNYLVVYLIWNCWLQPATEWAGVVYALLLIVCTAQGFELFVVAKRNKIEHAMEKDIDNNICHDNIEEVDSKHDNYNKMMVH